jgi:D-alanyl-D-alanine dipeptidase
MHWFVAVLLGQHPTDLVDVAAAIPDAVIDMRYATADNFVGEVLYPRAVCKLRRAVAERLARAADTLRAEHRRLLIWDCYRPISVQKRLWAKLPDPRYVADPRTGSVHDRGAAVDVALAGEPMPTAFDDTAGGKSQRAVALHGVRGVEAARLERAMVAAGFVPLATEWWHYDAPDAARYPLSDEPL